MKISKLQTLWIFSMSALYTGYVCFKSIAKRFTGKTTRSWVDATSQKWADKILSFVNVKYKVVNPHNVALEAGKAYILMCNHSSLYDIPLSFKAFPSISLRMLAKKEIKKIPFMGKGMAAAEFPFIDRKNRTQAIKDLEFVRELLESGIVMWIAPEGTRSKDGHLGAFKKGAFMLAIQTQATIIPIGIRGAYDILPARTLQLNLNKEAEIHIGEPVDASQYTLDTKDELIHQIRETMKELVDDTD